MFISSINIKIFIIIFFLIIPFHGIAIHSNNQYNNDTNISSFKTWLSHSWLKSYLIFDALEIEPKQNRLKLSFICNNGSKAQWDQIRLAFERISSIKFEEYIFNKACFLLEIPRDSMKIEINNNINSESPCFYREISFVDSLVVKIANCKDLTSKSILNYKKFNPIFVMTKVEVNSIDKKANEILDYLYEKCEKYFRSKGEYVKFYKTSTTTNSITFDVRNINNEVINASPFSFKSIEILRFTIQCQFHSDYVQFETIINGKVGGTLLKPATEKGYFDMEIEHKDELQNYINEFTNNNILKWLK